MVKIPVMGEQDMRAEDTLNETAATQAAAPQAEAPAQPEAPATPAAPEATAVEGAIWNPEAATGALHLGIDVGSTTVKLDALSQSQIVYAKYQRHHTDVRACARDLFLYVYLLLPDAQMTCAITGSGGLLLSQWLGLEFVQEVIASKRAVETLIPQTDVAIELGGEDAKIIYFDQGIEQRMNGTCAGGTGAFIDQMATLLHTDASGLNELAKGATTIYPIASRCGVFAKSDVQPLLNEGARQEDVAASIFQAVVTQTISGLACGRPHPRQRRLPGRPPAVPLRAAPPLLHHARPRRGAPHRARERAPLRGERRRHGARVREAEHLPAAH